MQPFLLLKIRKSLGSGGARGNMTMHALIQKLYIKCWDPIEGNLQEATGVSKWFELALGLHPSFLSQNFWDVVIAEGY